MLPNEDEKNLIEFLAGIYSIIPWSKMKTKKYPHDIFNHRVRAAARRSTIYEFASKLCNFFGLQSIPYDLQVYLDKMRPNEEKILIVLSTEHIPFCVRAIARAKEKKQGADMNEDKH